MKCLRLYLSLLKEKALSAFYAVDEMKASYVETEGWIK